MAPPNAACPAQEQLERFLACDSDAPRPTAYEAIDVHLNECPRCRDLAESIRRNNSLLRNFAPAARDAALIDAAGIDAKTADGSGAVGPTVEIRRPGMPTGSSVIDLPTDSFAGYQILREIHRGGQGVVYQALQKSTKRKVAIKVMREGPFAGTSDRARFEREVQVLGQLQHPHIVAIHDSGQAAGHFFFVMDYIAGQPLDTYMAGAREPGAGNREQGNKGSRDQGIKGTRDPATAGRRGGKSELGLSVRSTLELFQKICEAVNAAHLRGIIHRDLKPGNIRVDERGAPHCWILASRRWRCLKSEI